MKIPSTFSTFPVRDKKPLIRWEEYQKRFPLSSEIDTWTKQFPNSQRGIVTGKISKILVLDDDGGLDVKKYPIPKTWTQKTPRGGVHYIFRWTPDLESKVTTRTEIMSKVDVRGEGGFIVFYGWEQPYFLLPLSLPPKWLIDLLPNKDRSTGLIDNTEKSRLGDIFNDIHIGNRNDSFTRAAGSFRARGYSSADIFTVLTPKAREVDFDLNELKTICDSVCRYEPSIRIDESQAQSINDFLKDQEKVEWIVPGILAQKSIGFIAGLPETGKTWITIDLAIQCAKGGGLWLNKFPVKKAKVLFIDQERFKGETQRRLKAVIGAESLKNKGLELFIKTGTSIRLNLQHSFDAFRKELSELRPDLVIVDSFATFSTAEENNRKDIQAVLERVKELRNEFGCTFLFITHENKIAFDKEAGEPSIAQMAGSVAIPAAAEMVLTVRKHDSESSMVFHTKSTLASTIPPFLVKIIDQDETKTKIKVEAY